MSPFIEERVDEMTRLCLRHGVQRLDLFGFADRLNRGSRKG